MKLYQSATSPFVRKVRLTAAELGLSAEIEMLDVSDAYKKGGPLAREENIVKVNPLGQVPTMLTEDGTVLADSRVICEYLNHRGKGEIFPSDPGKRWNALMEQTVGDGLLDAALLSRYEGLLRPEERQWQPWRDGQMAKLHAALAVIEQKAATFGDRVDIGTITFASALAYLDLRFADLDWRKDHPATAAWFAAIEARPAFAANRLG
ncbi:glutathione S-transferase family protein [Bosea sp. (in: a-proteobacteria)]|uniref:glutathione S-transferase family protein n=1 Tax=Bosea sp. (in: a-proteobacteria) TaxID=1871050 RepID=UPI002FC77F17